LELADVGAFPSEHRDLRRLLYRNKPHIHRVIDRVLEQKKVDVLHIRKGARDKFKADEQ
jgi:hypothetical protein